MTADYLKFKVFVNSKVLDWIDKYSGKFPDLFIWRKIEQQYFNSVQENREQAQNERFQEKFHQLKIYQVIFERNRKEVLKMKNEFLKIRFECFEARKLMDQKSYQGQQEEEKKDSEFSQLEEEKVQAINFTLDMNAFVDDRDNNDDDMFLFQDEENSTQIHNQDSMTPIVTNNNNENEKGLSINIEKQIQDQNKFNVCDKNMTLYRVIQDNKKTLERRFIPLLGMFKVECAFFKELQSICLNVVKEKKELDNDYRGKVKITKKEVQDFEKEYKAIDQDDIIELQQAVEILLKQVNDLKKDLDLIRLSQENQSGSLNDNVIVLDDDEEDPDEQLFK